MIDKAQLKTAVNGILAPTMQEKTSILNVSAYHFVKLYNTVCLKDDFYPLCRKLKLTGTIVLAFEGINLMLAGEKANIQRFCAELKKDPRFSSMRFKASTSDKQPFKRLKIKLKAKIVPGLPDFNPVDTPAPYLSAKELKQWLDEGRDFILLDTRNAYEIKHGSFKSAQHLNSRTFNQFLADMEKMDADAKSKPIVTFCTGGIRCEKAAPMALMAGFNTVYQLEGGILSYFEQCGMTHFAGTCFVFDERRAIDASTVSETH